jgi:colanic acid biosynthesis protein WcaH
MGLDETAHAIESAVGDPRRGLPNAVFQLVTRLTPMLNVDVLVRRNGRTLLTWRDDAYYHGWHVPGGIVRYKERMADRLAEVARLELGTTIVSKSAPLAINEIIHEDRAVRGHFISFLFECELTGPLDQARHRTGPPRHGDWAWHAITPAEIIRSHEMYRRFIDGE